MELVAKVLCFGERHQTQNLREVIERTSTENLIRTLSTMLVDKKCVPYWNYVLHGCNLRTKPGRLKRYKLVLACLKELSNLNGKTEHKTSIELISRLCQDITTFTATELNGIVEFCLDICAFPGWKDLFPKSLNVLTAKQYNIINGESVSSKEYKARIVKNLSAIDWEKKGLLLPMAVVFRELELSNAELSIVLGKFASGLQELEPAEIPVLCFQLFSLCLNPGHLIILLLALDKYFDRHYYKRLLIDACSNSTNFDSIDAYSDKEMLETEETVLHHLDYCIVSRLGEQQVVAMLRNFQHVPHVILTPFMLSAFLSLTGANRECDASRVSRFALLTFIRNVVKCNEEERTMAETSIWCRDTFQRRQLNLKVTLKVLLDQNRNGKEISTPGLINFIFVLLKTKQSPVLNSLAIDFLTKFVRCRFIFGRGVVSSLAKWMVVNRKQNQYSECLTTMSIMDAYTVSECFSTIKEVINHLLWMRAPQSMRMMSFILPLLKSAPRIREAFLDMLRNAITSGHKHTQRMALYGLCMLLKQLNFSNSAVHTNHATSFCTQSTVSNTSILSQSQTIRSEPSKHFHMLTLDIMSTLRISLFKHVEMRLILYEYLQRAVELNTKLVPRVLQMIDQHFRMYFDTPTSNQENSSLTECFEIRYAMLVIAKDDQHMELEERDNLGRLIQFVSNCLAIYDATPGGYDTVEMRRLLATCIQRIVDKRLKMEDTLGPSTNLKCALLQQQLNLLEGLITHLVLSSKPSNTNVRHILPLFNQHQNLMDGLQTVSGKVKKSLKRGKSSDNTIAPANNTVNGKLIKQSNALSDNIWDLPILETLLHLLFDDYVSFANHEDTVQLRANVKLVRYVLAIATRKIEQIRHEPEYKNVANSKRILKHLTDITKVIYERCIKRLPELWRDFDLGSAAIAAQCFMQCLRTCHVTYKKNFAEFVKDFDTSAGCRSEYAPQILQNNLDEFMSLQEEETIGSSDVGAQVPAFLLQALEILYDHIGYEERSTTESYTWLLNFCRSYELHNQELSLVHRLLFTQRLKTHSGPFFDSVAKQLAMVLGTVTENTTDDMSNRTQFRSISALGIKDCLLELFNAVRKQLTDVNYFILKAKNLSYLCRVVPVEDRDQWTRDICMVERSVCTQLINVTKTLRVLTNMCVPFGNCLDGLLRLLIQHYHCLRDLTKHFMPTSTQSDVSKVYRMEPLLRVVGRPLAANIYQLILYVEKNVLDEEALSLTKRNPEAEEAKVLRETRFIPKVIRAIEEFNTQLILLSKRSRTSLDKYLHPGIVRDFRINIANSRATEHLDSDSDEEKTISSEDNDSSKDDDANNILEKEKNAPQTHRYRRVLSNAGDKKSQPKPKRPRLGEINK